MPSSEAVHFEGSLGAAICHRCEAGVVVDSANSIDNHFRSGPHHLKGAALADVRARLQAWPTRRTAEVAYPSVDDQPIRRVPNLSLHRGWRCRHCDIWLSVSLVASKTHLRTAHDVRRGQPGHDLDACLLQTVFREKRLVRWFRVAGVEGNNNNDDSDREGQGQGQGQSQGQHHPAGSAAIDIFVRSQARVLGVITDQERSQAMEVHGGEDRPSSVTPWVRSCGFDRYLRGLDKREMQRSCRKPDHVDEESEAALLRRIALMAEQMLEETWTWCVDGPGCRLTRPMAVVLSQFWTEATIHARGFRVGIQPDTKTRYFRTWINGIYCYWRVSSGRTLARAAPARPGVGGDGGDGGDDRDTHGPALRPLFTGSGEQQKAFQRCMEAAADGKDDVLQRCILGFSMSLMQQDLLGNRFDSPLLSYCALLAVNHTSQGRKLPGNFNSALSAMIYCAQLWVFQDACRAADDEPGRSMVMHGEMKRAVGILVSLMLLGDVDLIVVGFPREFL